jgi:predicted amidohydrolase
MSRVRIASLQYFIRPVERFEQFADQVEGLVMTAADYKCQLVVFPEYFTTQLLTLGNVKRPIHEQVRDLPRHVPRYVELFTSLAKKHDIYIVGGTILTNGDGDGKIHNEAFIFGPGGEHVVQSKLHMTRFESEEWKVSARGRIKVVETRFGRIGVSICYDVEFPEVARAYGRLGVQALIVPSCTDDRAAFLRVRYCSQARAIENQIYVVQSPTVGSLPMVPAVSLNYGQAAIFTPSDFPFARDGILAEGIPNQETMVIGELDMATLLASRTTGTVLPLNDSLRTGELVAHTEITPL